MRNKLIYLLVSIFFFPSFALAQVDGTLTLTPQNPAPYDTVVVTLTSFSFDVNVAMITWSNKGKVLLSGLGKKSISLPVGDVGQELPLSVTATTADGSSLTQNITISPQSVDLMFEGKESYVPPFYEGRSLPSDGANVLVTAFPTISESGRRVPASNLSYSWYVNDDYKDGSSGIGKSTFTVPLDYLSDSTDVRVLVRSPLGNTAEKTISIYPHAVMPLFYSYDELLGTDYSKTFIRRLELASGITLDLEPYYLSNQEGLGASASYDWYLNGLPVTPQEKTLLSLQPKANSYGTRTLSVAVANARRKLQKGESSLEVIFDTRAQ
jgi:hypothetical protein